MINPHFDPYWEFDAANHLRPRVSKSEFFRLTGYPFLSYLCHLFPKELFDEMQELKIAMQLSYGQKVLYYWSNLSGQVSNGGFVQLYYNRYGQYMPVVIKGLAHIGDTEAAALFQEGENIYIKNKELIEASREDDLFDSDIYDRLEEFEPVEDACYKIFDKTRYKLEEYIRNHPNEFCLDEEGNEIDGRYSGECKTFYANGNKKEVFQLRNGIIEGEFKSYFENGKLKERMVYATEEGRGIESFYHDGLFICPITFIGKSTGEKEEYYENGNLKFKSTLDEISNTIREETFYENGHPEKLENRTLEKMEKTGEHKQWYENGQLKQAGWYLDRYKKGGPWTEFYYDGHIKVKGEYKEGKFLIHLFYDEEGNLLLKDGTGLYVVDNNYGPKIFYSHGSNKTESWYKNYELDGVTKVFKNGTLIEFREYKEGKTHGYHRTYYNSGKLQQECYYDHDKLIARQTYPKCDPKGKIVFLFQDANYRLIEKGFEIPDKGPVCINEEEVKQQISFPQILFQEEYLYRDLNGSACFWLDVDEKGNVTDTAFSSAYMTNGEEFNEVAKNMVFRPATKNGLPLKSCIYIIVHYEVE